MNSKISLLRVIAIITVVFGQSIILYSSEWNMMSTNIECTFLDNIKRIINLYQMQLYFFISGFLMYYAIQKKKHINEFIRGKMVRLILPYFLFGLFWMIPIKVALGIPSYRDLALYSILYEFVVGINNGHLWFLYTLFILFAVLYPLNRLLTKFQIGGIVLLFFCSALTIVNRWIPFSLFNVHDVCIYALWFQIGVVCNQHKTKLFLFVSIIACMISSLENHTAILSLLIVLLLYYLTPSFKSTWIQDIDSKSFGIYLLHSPLIYITYTYIPNTHPGIVVFCNFVVFGIISYLVTTIIKKQSIVKI